MSDTSQNARLLRLAVQNLACAPQAQRRYVQLGMMPRALGNLERIGADLSPLIDAGDIDRGQADLVAQLRDEVARQVATHDDFLEEKSASPRDYLFGTALETDDWHAVRHLARRCFTALAGEESPFIAIMAK
jgi:hypothetical protein